MNTMLEKLDELEARVNSLVKALEEERAENERLRSENEQRSLSEQKAEELRTALEQEKARHSAKALESESRLAPLEEECRTLKEQLAFEKEKYGKIASDLNSLRSLREDDRQNWEEARKKIEGLLKELEEVPEEYGEPAEPGESAEPEMDQAGEEHSEPEEIEPDEGTNRLEDGEIEEIDLEGYSAVSKAGDGKMEQDAGNEPPSQPARKRRTRTAKNDIMIEETPEEPEDINAALDEELESAETDETGDDEMTADGIEEEEDPRAPQDEDGYLFEETKDDRPEPEDETDIFPPKKRKRKDEDDLI